MTNQSQISTEELRSLLHPSEELRFNLALIVVVSVLGIGLSWILGTIPVILGFVGMIIGIVWFTLQVAKAHLTANAVKVSENNFPEINDVLHDVLYVLDYDKPIDVYIVEEGTVNAFLARFFQTKFIILNSELVEDMIEHDTLLQIKWVIARFVGSLKAKNDKLFLLRVIMNSVEKLKIFNIFILPYERAIQYSGDQIGLAVCGDLSQAMMAFQKFMVGNKLSKKITLEGMQDQKREMGVFAFLARLGSTHPHVVDRFHNLLAFAEVSYPEMYDQYMRSK